MPEQPRSKEQPEKEQEKRPEKESFEYFKIYLEAFDNFLNLSDKPGRFVTEEEKMAAVEESKKLGHETPEMKSIMESKVGSKYRAGAFRFLTWAKELLNDPAFIKNVSVEELRKLEIDTNNLFDKIQELDLKNERITKEEVDKGVEIINRLKAKIQKI